jgi:hypothetical protein
MFESKEILEELKKINASIQYQTKIMEELFMRKDESKNEMNQKKVLLKNMVDAMTEAFKSKGMDTTHFSKMMNGLNLGGNKNEHQIP